MDIIDRLHEIANAIADANYSELTMRIPAEPDRDADLVVSSAAREIARLRSELAEYRQKNALLREALDDAAERMDRARGIIRTPHGVGWALLAEANDQLRAELAECKRDAERYRWLRRHHIRSDPDMSGRHHWMTLGRGLGRGVTAEEAIDAARKGGCEK